MDTPHTQPVKIVKFFRPTHRSLVHELAFDRAADALLGLPIADELLRHLVLKLATEPSLARYPQVCGGRLQRAADGWLAVDFSVDADDVVHLVRLSLLGTEG